jgi:hypothetical protein
MGRLRVSGGGMARGMLVIALLLLGLTAGAAVLAIAGPVTPAAAHPEPGDIDGDGVRDEVDNCPNDRNGDQKDTDGDGPGDKCDPDMDGDGLANEQDNCPPIFNPGQGNECSADNDGDGVANYEDNCLDVWNPRAPLEQPNYDARFTYGDLDGDACDPDDDGDGVFDDVDNCPITDNPDQTDADGDGRGYFCDADDTPRSTPGGGAGGGGAGGGPAGGGGSADSTAPRVTLSVRSRHRLASIEGGLVVRVRCSEACAATLTLRANRRVARRLRLPGSRVAAKGTAQVEREASTYAFVRFSRKVKRRVWRQRSTRLTLHAEAIDRAGNRGRAVRTVTLVR